MASLIVKRALSAVEGSGQSVERTERSRSIETQLSTEPSTTLSVSAGNPSTPLRITAYQPFNYYSASRTEALVNSLTRQPVNPSTSH